MVTNKEIAKALNVSENHLSKVLQRLGRVGLVKSVRGPKGGFILGKAANDISLLDVYESIEGPFVMSNCLLGIPICDGNKCILGGLLKTLNTEVRDYLAGTKLSEFADVMS